MIKDFPLFLSLMWTLHRVLISDNLHGGFQDVEDDFCVLDHVLLTGKVIILSPAFLHSLQWIKYWELDYACCLCWSYFSSSVASPTLVAADLRRKTPFFNWERHINNNNQVNCHLSYERLSLYFFMLLFSFAVCFLVCGFWVFFWFFLVCVCVFLAKYENLICISEFHRT